MSIEYIIIGLRMKPLTQWHVPDLICLNAGVSLTLVRIYVVVSIGFSMNEYKCNRS